MRHVGEFEDQKIILVGYNPSEQKALFVRPEAFNGADQDWLSKIVESGYAQQQKFLVRALQRETHPSGEDAFVYVMKHGQPLRIPPQELKMYDKAQSIEWFGEPSNFLLEHERRAGKVGPKRMTTAAEHVFPQPNSKQQQLPRPVVENIEPALPIPDANAPIEIPMRAAPSVPNTSTPAAPELQKPLELDPNWVVPQVSPPATNAVKTAVVGAPQLVPQFSFASAAGPTASFDEVVSNLSKVAEALKSTSEKLEKLTALETRIRNLEKTVREKDKKKPADPA